MSGSDQHREHSSTAATLSPRPTRIRWLVFVLASGSSWFLYLHRYTFNLIRPELADEYNFSNTQLDSIFTLFNFSYACGQIPGGVVCDYFGSHLFLSLIILLWSLALPCIGLTGNAWGLGGIRLMFGAAQAGCYPSLSKVTRVWFPRRTRTVVQGWVASFFGRSGGAMSTIVMGTFLMGYCGLGWRSALVVMGLAGVAFAAVFLLLYRNQPEQDPRVNEAERELIIEGDVPHVSGDDQRQVLPFRRALKNRSLSVFIFQQLMNAGADNIYVYLMGSYFAARGFDVVAIGWLASLPLFGGAIGGVVGGVVNDGLIHLTGNRRWSRSTAGFVGKFLACIFMFVAIYQVSGVATAWCLFVVKFFSDWTQPTVWGTCTDMGGRFSATVFSIINTSGSVGGIVTPPVLGIILDRYTSLQMVGGVEQAVTNFTPIFVIVAGMYLVSALCWFFIDCTHAIDEDAPSAGDQAGG